MLTTISFPNTFLFAWYLTHFLIACFSLWINFFLRSRGCYKYTWKTTWPAQLFVLNVNTKIMKHFKHKSTENNIQDSFISTVEIMANGDNSILSYLFQVLNFFFLFLRKGMLKALHSCLPLLPHMLS